MTASSPPVPDHRIGARTALPGRRAMVGALLVVVAGVGVFAAYTDATRPPTASYVVASRDLRPGDAVDLADLEEVAIDLPSRVASRAFESPQHIDGRVLLAPLRAGEIVHESALSQDAPAEFGTELAMALPRDHVAAGRLRAGDRVDVFVTTDEETTSVVRGVLVVALDTTSEGGVDDGGVEVVVTVPDDVVAAAVHALRRGDVTVVRSTFSHGRG